MQHGMGGNSDNWTMTINGTKPDKDVKPMAITLAEAGFDVWMANNAGTKYGWEHDVYTTDDKEFWDIDWTTNAVYDFPALVAEI